MRRAFADCLLEHARKDKRIWVVTADLGYKLWDQFRDELPDQFLNTGAAEFSAAGICVGLALKNKIPFFYSITPFALYRPFEVWRNYANHERIPVKIIGSGRDSDYHIDGFSHYAGDDKLLFNFADSGEDDEFIGIFNNITPLWPKTKEEIPDIVKEMIESDKPYYLNLRR